MEIREKLWNIELIINDIKLFPQTYETILKNEVNNGTCQTILRRKINNLIKQGKIFKMAIPGTRFGKVVFYIYDKKYNIVVEGDRLGSKVYAFYNFTDFGNFRIKVDECWELKGSNWEKIYNKIFFEGKILKWI